MSKKVRVLLAEDDYDDQIIFSSFLGMREDIEVLPIAENGKELLKYLGESAEGISLPDIIILDHNMPKLNGSQTLAALKSDMRFARVPIFIYSTYADQSLTDRCLASGAAMVATKPFDSEGYNKMIDSFLSFIPAK